jgi:bacteriocin-like protein
MVDEQEVKKPGEMAKETNNSQELTDDELDNVSGGVMKIQ